MQLIKRWLTYLLIFFLAMWVVDQYGEYKQLQEFEVVRKDLIKQEKDYERQEKDYERQEKNCLKNALYYEARSEGKLGIIAVASVIENRKKSSVYPNEYCGVINQHKQFSYTLQGRPDVEMISGRLMASDKIAYKQVSDVADKMLDGRFESVLHPSVMWYAKASVKNYWTKSKKVVARIGDHVFYKKKQNKK